MTAPRPARVPEATPYRTLRWVLSSTGAGTLAAGAAAVFLTENGPGAASLVAAGAALIALGVFADRVRSFEGAGMKVELTAAAAAAALESAAQRADDSGQTETAQGLREDAARLMSLAGPLAQRYQVARGVDRPRAERIADQERLVREWAELARGGRFSPASVADLFASGEPAFRLGSLAMMAADPDLIDPAVVAAALRSPATAFEQYQALRVVRSAVKAHAHSASELAQVVHETATADLLGGRDSDRSRLAAHIATMARDLDRP